MSEVIIMTPKEDVVSVLTKFFEESSNKIRIKKVTYSNDEEYGSYDQINIMVKGTFFYQKAGEIWQEEDSDTEYMVSLETKDYRGSFANSIVELLRAVEIPGVKFKIHFMN